MNSIHSYAIGVRRRRQDKTLDTIFSNIALGDDLGDAPAMMPQLQKILSKQKDDFNWHNAFIPLNALEMKALQQDVLLPFTKNVVLTHVNVTQQSAKASTYAEAEVGLFLLTKQQATAQSIGSVEEAYFKLQLLSQRLCKPNELSLLGLFDVLLNLAWTNQGPMLIEDVDAERLKSLTDKIPLIVYHVDKFPYLVNYHVPEGVRIADGSRVRLGAHLAKGTTIMPAGYVNFNAGTMGNSMIEGRISAGVVVNKDSDIGGGASIMGTLSGGNQTVLSIGSACLLGANSGTGISLGYGSTIAAGVYVTAGSKIALYNQKNEPINLQGNVVIEGKNVFKGKDLSGREKCLFLIDSTTGRLICKPNPKTIELNESLHQNQ